MDGRYARNIPALTGAECEEIWLVGQTSDQAIASYIAGGEYPDFISGNIDLYEEWSGRYEKINFYND